MATFCSTCQRIFSARARQSAVEDSTLHQTCLADVEQSAASGCYICSLLWKELSRDDWGPPAPADSRKPAAVSNYDVFGAYRPEELQLIVRFDKHGRAFDRTTYRQLNFRLQNLQENESPCPGRDLGSSTHPLHRPFNLDYARSWLDQCLHHHDKCRQALPDGGSDRPTRLLAIDQPSAGHVRLVATDDLGNDAGPLPYATLSYCWGQAHTFLLSASTVQSLQQGLPVSALGRTSRDAIAVARALGLAWIWIDSLCILQDSEADWHREAPRMASIYSHAVVNIAATAGADSDAGLWPPVTAADLVDPPIVTLQGTGAPDGRYGMHRSDLKISAFDGPNAPLLSRAWVVQELLLAPRVLHVCSTQLFWECAALDACEMYPRGLPSILEPFRTGQDMKSQWGDWTAPSKPGLDVVRTDNRVVGFQNVVSTDSNHLVGVLQVGSAEQKALRRWSNTIFRYTQCGLTYPSDKLVAISGLAKRLQQTTGDEYVAGLWKRSFVYQLAWWNSSRSGLRTATSPYRAPTWSWASIDGTAEASLSDQAAFASRISVVTIEDCVVETDPEDRTIAVRSGYLRLSGYLITLRLAEDAKTLKERPDYRPTGEVHVDGRDSSLLANHIFMDYEFPVSADAQGRVQLHALAVTVTPWLTKGVKYARNVSGVQLILLSPVQGKEAKRGWFQRVGFMDVHLAWLNCNGGCFEDLAKVQNESWMEYESINDKGQHVVVVV